MFSLLKLIFVCFTPLVNHLTIYNQVNNYNEIVEFKKRNNYIQDFGYIVVSPVEFLSSYALVNYLGNTLRNPVNVGDTISMPYLNSDTRLVSSNLINYSNNDFGYSQGQSPYSSKMVYQGTYNYTYSKTVRWKLQFTFNNGGSDGFIEYSVVYLYNDSSSNTSYIGMPTCTYSTYNVPNNINNFPFIVANSDSWIFKLGLGSADYKQGLNVGYDQGYDIGYDEGLDRGKEIASDPASEIYETTYNIGYQAGRTDGIETASANSGVPALIFSGILNVALLPVDVFLQMFQYEVFGINIAGLISGLLTVAMVITVLRFVIGGKSKDD